ncbi:MAG TPA: carboxypeptidase regulatory-like domain-containing protein, partial [Vicinamibacterales bacterium]|nr:carboxypeptidase regulatory-like domain-containing protein [Vicinamibacterales bacterium]
MRATIAASLLAAALSGEQSPAAIRGRVLADDTGSPLPNACVAIADGPDAVRVTTDAAGFFTLTGAHQDRQTVSVSKSGYAKTSVELRDLMEVRLARGAVITGHVIDDLGGPVSLMSVVAERVTDGRVHIERMSWAETDDTGAYRLFGLAAGDYVVGLTGTRLVGTAGTTPIPIERLVRTYYPHTDVRAEADVVPLRAGAEVTGIDFHVDLPAPPGNRAGAPPAGARPERTGAIRGRVLRADGLPARAARVDLSSADRLFSPFGMATDLDGRYEFTDLKPGRYIVAATDSTSMTTARFGQRGPLDRGAIVTVTAGGAVEGVDVAMPRVSVIAGRVVDEYGDAIENANVRLQRIEWSRGRRRLASVRGVASRDTDDQGRYRLFGVPPGRYLVSAAVGEPLRGRLGAVNDLPGYVRTYFPGTPSATEAQPLDIATSDQALNINFALSTGQTGRIAGRVFAADGHPFRGTVHLIASARSAAIAAE